MFLLNFFAVGTAEPPAILRRQIGKVVILHGRERRKGRKGGKERGEGGEGKEGSKGGKERKRERREEGKDHQNPVDRALRPVTTPPEQEAEMQNRSHFTSIITSFAPLPALIRTFLLLFQCPEESSVYFPLPLCYSRDF